VSLSEHDAQLELLLENRLEEHKGKLNHPFHLSWFERFTVLHDKYDPSWVKKLVSNSLQDHCNVTTIDADADADGGDSSSREKQEQENP